MIGLTAVLLWRAARQLGDPRAGAAGAIFFTLLSFAMLATADPMATHTGMVFNFLFCHRLLGFCLGVGHQTNMARAGRRIGLRPGLHGQAARSARFDCRARALRAILRLAEPGRRSQSLRSAGTSARRVSPSLSPAPPLIFISTVSGMILSTILGPITPNSTSPRCRCRSGSPWCRRPLHARLPRGALRPGPWNRRRRLVALPGIAGVFPPRAHAGIRMAGAWLVGQRSGFNHAQRSQFHALFDPDPARTKPCLWMGLRAIGRTNGRLVEKDAFSGALSPLDWSLSQSDWPAWAPPWYGNCATMRQTTGPPRNGVNSSRQIPAPVIAFLCGAICRNCIFFPNDCPIPDLFTASFSRD